MNVTLTIMILVGLAFLYLIFVYNALASVAVRIKEAWSQIDVQLKRRVDLIPNLVASVKAYAKHEEKIFENVNKARAQLMGAGSPSEIGKADHELTGALKNLFALAEAYPELKAQEGFIKLQTELSDTEDKVAYSRQFYNSVVRELNEKLAVFPTNMFGKLFGFKEREFFEANPSERESIKVNFEKE